MGIKYSKEKEYYIVTYSKRHPLTKKSRGIRRVGFKTMAEAKKAYKKIQNELLVRFYNDSYPYWNDVVDKFIIYYTNTGVGKHTIINYKGGLRAHTHELWKSKRINEITTTDIRELIQEGLGDTSQANRKNIYKYIKGVFRFALENDYVLKDPSPRLKFKKYEKIQKVLKEDQIITLLQSAKNQKHSWFPVWALACYTGMRNGELYALKWNRVDLEKRIIVVSDSWTRQEGFKSTKSGDDRSVEIASSLMPLMYKLYDNRQGEFVLPRLGSWSTGGQSEILRTFLLSINLPNIRFHDLRASWATLMLSKGVAPIKVMSMAGWKDLKTMQIYIRKSGIHIRGITDALNFL